MRLIDADAMRQDWLENGENEFVYDTNAFLDSIDAQPTIDAVPVVRCKDCKWFIYDDDVDYVCAQIGKYMGFNDFCSYGERKDGEG